VIFNSLTFLVFFAFVLALHTAPFFSWHQKKINLLLASYIFYAAWNPPFVALLWISTVAVDTSYATVVVPQMVLMGLGMGLISTPATESILLVLPPARAGVGSAVNDATRELGGTLGVAVVGSVFSSVFGSHLAGGSFGSLPGSLLARAQDSVGVAQVAAARDPRLLPAFHDSFLAAMSTACVVVGLLCLAGAVFAAALLPGRIPAAVETEDEPERQPLAAA